MYPKYKANRHKKELTPKEKRFEKKYHRQMRLLRKKYLKMIGYQNVFHQKGYEADDLIASVRQFLRIMRTSQNIIIVSADHDLYQLIDSEVSVFHPREERTVTLQSFTKMFGIRPAVWPMVKAIGGCATDNIKGIKGVGEKTAIRLVRNKLPKTSKVVKRHLSNKGKKIIARNLQLVCLPFPGTKSVKLRHNKLSQQGWRKVCRILGFSSLRDKAFPKVPD
jgi:5'-3' exonuclease